jgi:hypothetical protein
MKIKKNIILIMLLILTAMISGKLLATSTQKFINVKVDKKDKKYATSLLLENAGIDEVVKVLAQYTGSQISIIKPPEKNKKITVEFYFDKNGSARKLVWYGKHVTVKTYITDGDKEKVPMEVSIKSKVDPNSNINISISKKISVRYRNIKLEELLRRFSEIGKITFKLDPALKNKDIRVTLTMKNFKPEDALKALASLENLEIKKLNESLFLVKEKKKQ